MTHSTLGQYGYYTDNETGLLCLTHRYYDPGTGKFLTRDPIGYAGGANLYGFCGGNPVNEMDPNGTQNAPPPADPEPEKTGRGDGDEGELFLPQILIDAREEDKEKEARESRNKTGNLGRALALRDYLRGRQFSPELAAKFAPRSQPRIIVIGEGMGDIEATARSFGAQNYKPWKVVGAAPGGRWTAEQENLIMTRNRRWIQDHIRAGDYFLDIGRDSRPQPSRYYAMEKAELAKAKYPNVVPVPRVKAP